MSEGPELSSSIPPSHNCRSWRSRFGRRGWAKESSRGSTADSLRDTSGTAAGWGNSRPATASARGSTSPATGPGSKCRNRSRACPDRGLAECYRPIRRAAGAQSPGWRLPRQRKPQPPAGKYFTFALLRHASANCLHVIAALGGSGRLPRQACTAGSNSPTKMPMIAITTSNSTRVKPGRGRRKLRFGSIRLR